jgi:hypothetical protein
VNAEQAPDGNDRRGRGQEEREQEKKSAAPEEFFHFARGPVEKEHIEKKKVSQQLFGKSNYSDVKIRGMLSDTLQLVEDFLAIENMKKQGLVNNWTQLSVRTKNHFGIAPCLRRFLNM